MHGKVRRLLVAGLFFSVSAAASAATLREPLFELRREWTVIRTYSTATADWRDGRLVIVPKGRNCHFDAEPTPMPRPCFSPERVVIRGTGDTPARVTLGLLRFADGAKTNVVVNGSREFVFDVREFAQGDYCQFRLFSFVQSARYTNSFEFASADYERTAPAIEGVKVDVFPDGKSIRVFDPTDAGTVRFATSADAPCELSGRLEFRDWFGRGFDLPVRATVSPGGTVRLPFGPVKGMGLWKVTARLRSADGASVEREARFAVMAPHPVTPFAAPGEFRPGINYHISRYSERHRELTLDLIVRAGAKLVRCGGFGLSDVVRKGTNDWTRSDTYFREIRSRGLDIDAGVLGTPLCLASEEKKKAPWSVMSRSYPIDGAQGRFCRDLASRYGTGIANYACGNELDLVSPEQLTPDEIVAIHKEVYAGIKAGCPTATVSTTGFALPDSDFRQIRQKGVHERVLAEAKGSYDVHAIHLHCGLDHHEELMARFFAKRRELGVTVPWYQNESALTTTLGNERNAAETVWKKMFWARAHGSTDYVWYNLRATGWNPKDSEQGYGMVTADLQPRGTYAAFGAYTTVTHGFDRGRPVFEKARRRLYAFSSVNCQPTSANLNCKLLAGWDANLLSNATVKVKTDARRVVETDLMGNERELKLADGAFAMELSSSPRAWTLYGATSFEPDSAALAQTAERKIPGGNEFTLADVKYVREVYPADPKTAYRCWQGPSDCSARLRFKRRGAKLAAEAWVTDDRDAPLDAVLISSCGSDYRLPRVGAKDGVAHYRGLVTLPRATDAITVSVIDDDGEGEDLRLFLDCRIPLSDK